MTSHCNEKQKALLLFYERQVFETAGSNGEDREREREKGILSLRDSSEWVNLAKGIVDNSSGRNKAGSHK